MTIGITGPVKFVFDTGRVKREAMAFWCVMIPRRLFDELGLLDEVFSPGMGEDGDFCVKATIAGYELCQVPLDGTHEFGDEVPQNWLHLLIPDQVFPIAHVGSGTFGWLRSDEIIERNKRLLDKRYGNSLEEAYDWCLNHTCDINEHFPTLRRYASKCEHITEFGTRGVFSTYAFMAAKPKKLLTYDIVVNSNIWVAANIASEHKIEFGFMERDTTACEIEPTDLLFIDTWHTYEQLKTELALHGDKAHKYLIFHDTTSFGAVGEDGGLGLIKAIDEFLERRPWWTVRERHFHNNGLLVLERVVI